MVQNQNGAQGKSESTPAAATKKSTPRNRSSSTGHLSSASPAVSKSIKGKKDNKRPSTQPQLKTSEDSTINKSVAEPDVESPEVDLVRTWVSAPATGAQLTGK